MGIFPQSERTKLQMAHIKLSHGRAFLLLAYLLQTHEMLFDAHWYAFRVFGGVSGRGIYDNMKTAVDRVGRGKELDPPHPSLPHSGNRKRQLPLQGQFSCDSQEKEGDRPCFDRSMTRIHSQSWLTSRWKTRPSSEWKSTQLMTHKTSFLVRVFVPQPVVSILRRVFRLSCDAANCDVISVTCVARFWQAVN